MSSLPAVKTVVMVKELIAALEKTRDKELRDSRAAMSEYKAARLAYVRSVKTHLKEKLASLTPDFEPPPRRRGRGGDLAEWIVDGLPEEPVYPNDEKCIRSKYDGLIAQLRLSAEPKVRLSPEDFQRFMAGDASACRC